MPAAMTNEPSEPLRKEFGWWNGEELPAWDITDWRVTDILDWINRTGRDLDRARIVDCCPRHECHLVFPVAEDLR